MKKKEIEIGKQYVCKISGKMTVVKITGESPYKGWNALNTGTGRMVRIKSPQKLWRRAEEII